MSDALIFCLIYFGALVIFGSTGFFVAVMIIIIALSSTLYFYGPVMVGPMSDLAWSTSNNYLLIAMPLFILLGEILMRSGITERMYETLSMWMTRVPGRLLHTNILASALDALAPLLASRVESGGRIALSGILRGQEAELLQRYASWFDDLAVHTREDWVRIDGRRR